MNFINVYNKMDRRITKCDRSGVNMNKKENIMKKENTAIRLKTIMNMRGLRQVDILNLTVPYCQKYNVKMHKSQDCLPQ